MAYGNESRNADLASVRSWNLELDPAAARRGANINDTKPSRAACNVQPQWGAHGSVYRCIKLLSPRPRSQVTREQREPPRRMRAHTAPVRGHGQRTRLCVPSVDRDSERDSERGRARERESEGERERERERERSCSVVERLQSSDTRTTCCKLDRHERTLGESCCKDALFFTIVKIVRDGQARTHIHTHTHTVRGVT